MTSNNDLPIWTRDEPESPCIRVCVLHPVAKLCMGCYRSGDEISRWTRYSPSERREIMDALPARAEIVENAKPVRRGRRRDATT